MNILNNNIGWILPERCATRATYDTIKQNGLYIKNTLGFTPPHSRGYTHETNQLVASMPFAINVRNPYAQAVSLWRLHQSISLQSFYSPYSELDTKLTIMLDELKEGSTGKDINKIWLKTIPSTLEFNEWLKSNNTNSFNHSLYSYKVPEIQPSWIVKVENYEEDVCKVPGITKISKLNPCTSQYYGVFANYIILNSIFNNNFNNDYYLNVIKNNIKIYKSIFEATPKTYPQIMLKRLFNQLTSIPIENIASFIKNITMVPSSSECKLVDLKILYSNNWKELYTQELADVVYNARKDWFIKFDYDKDSWKQ